jgi:UDP-GlcNAc:undecaprenyl-phosphate GlcNAc-1-phosphate transferase
MGAVDVPDERKIHNDATPHLGGIAIYLAFLIGIGMAFIIFKGQVLKEFIQLLMGLFIGGTIILALGLYDDLKGAGALIKLPVQIIAALVLIKFGFVIRFLTNPFGPPFSLGWLAIPVTIIWVVALTNAINWIDGLDGLATGVTFIASLTLFFVAIQSRNIVLALLAICMAGATLGFLRYNFPPARIFMGDTGSNFLGFVLAAAGIVGSQKGTVTVTLLVPIVLLLVPLVDSSFAVIRRALRGIYIFRPDTEHIHHRLLNLGLSQRKVVLSLYLITVALSGIAYIFPTLEGYQKGIVLFGLTVIVFVNLIGLRIVEVKASARNKK